MTNKEFLKKLKILKSIKAGQNLHLSLDGKISQLENNAGKDNLSIAQFLFAKPIFIPVILAIILIGSGTGMVFASQNSLPTDILYPIKIASEKTQLALEFNNLKKIELHLKFSKKRLKEAKKMVEQKKAKQDIQLALANYRQEVKEINDILNLINHTKIEKINQEVSFESFENENENEYHKILIDL